MFSEITFLSGEQRWKRHIWTALLLILFRGCGLVFTSLLYICISNAQSWVAVVLSLGSFFLPTMTCFFASHVKLTYTDPLCCMKGNLHSVTNTFDLSQRVLVALLSHNPKVMLNMCSKYYTQILLWAVPSETVHNCGSVGPSILYFWDQFEECAAFHILSASQMKLDH